MKKLVLMLGAFAFTMTATAQNGNGCGTDDHRHQLHQEHPEVLQDRNLLEAYTAQFAQNFNPHAKTGSIVIPVVFHVNDPTNPQKVTMAQVQSALDIMNEDFTATNADISNIRPEFTGIVADMDIHFCLASIDPNGQATTGITYHYNSYNGREPDGYGSSVKGVEYWPANKYLNIWIVNYPEDDGDAYRSGWAFLPSDWAVTNEVDGIIFNHRYLGYTGSSEVSGPSSWQAEMARVMTHEVGHYLNLYHTFENYCSAPGDNVADTPPVYYHGSNNCDQLGTFCSGVTVVQDQNYMDYTPCPSMYTAGQKTRVHAALNSSVAQRNNLWTQGNLTATGCYTSNASLDEISEIANTKIFPNPANTEINLQFNLHQTVDLEITIRNMIGQSVSTRAMTVSGADIVKVPIEDLKEGIYLVEIRNKETTFTLKVIKQK
jgi:hypothetical protein